MNSALQKVESRAWSRSSFHASNVLSVLKEGSYKYLVHTILLSCCSWLCYNTIECTEKNQFIVEYI